MKKFWAFLWSAIKGIVADVFKNLVSQTIAGITLFTAASVVLVTVKGWWTAIIAWMAPAPSINWAVLLVAVGIGLGLALAWLYSQRAIKRQERSDKEEQRKIKRDLVRRREEASTLAEQRRLMESFANRLDIVLEILLHSLKYDEGNITANARSNILIILDDIETIFGERPEAEGLNSKTQTAFLAKLLGELTPFVRQGRDDRAKECISQFNRQTLELAARISAKNVKT